MYTISKNSLGKLQEIFGYVFLEIPEISTRKSINVQVRSFHQFTT